MMVKHRKNWTMKIEYLKVWEVKKKTQNQILTTKVGVTWKNVWLEKCEREQLKGGQRPTGGREGPLSVLSDHTGSPINVVIAIIISIFCCKCKNWVNDWGELTATTRGKKTKKNNHKHQKPVEEKSSFQKWKNQTHFAALSWLYRSPNQKREHCRQIRPRSWVLQAVVNQLYEEVGMIA